MDGGKTAVTLLEVNGEMLSLENHADIAEKIIKKKDQLFKDLTTTKLRRIYGFIRDLNAQIISRKDFELHKNKLQYLKARMAYEAGREKSVKRFLTEAKLIEAINHINEYEEFELYCRYAESLVAYFKFYEREG